MLDIILNNHRPSVWSAAHYDRTFVTIALGRGEQEYEEVAAPFRDINILQINRVQNPYILGRYKLRKEQLERKSGAIHEILMYHPLRNEDIEVVAEYNCDYRRYSKANASQYGDKRPKFYKSPQIAKQRCEQNYQTCPSIVVVRVMTETSYPAEVVQRNWDTEYVPEYIVKLSE